MSITVVVDSNVVDGNDYNRCRVIKMDLLVIILKK